MSDSESDPVGMSNKEQQALLRALTEELTDLARAQRELGEYGEAPEKLRLDRHEGDGSPQH